MRVFARIDAGMKKTAPAPLPMTQQILAVAAAYCEATGLSTSRVSTIVFNDGKKLALIENGADLSTGKFESAMGWFSSNWPEEAVWPAGIVRPFIAASAAG